VIARGGRQLRHDPGRQRQIHVQSSATFGADHVIVALDVGVVPGTVAVAKLNHPRLSARDEQTKRSVDGRGTNTGLPGPNSLDNLDCSGVIRCFPEHVKDRLTLRSHPKYHRCLLDPASDFHPSTL
jgi:hypothetical protein